jgi:hypothetical protein
MRTVVKWIIRAVLGLVALAVLSYGVLAIWPELLFPEYNPKIGTGVALGAYYGDVAARWGAPGFCTPDLHVKSRERTCLWVKYTRHLTWEGFESDTMFVYVEFVGDFLTSIHTSTHLARK